MATMLSKLVIGITGDPSGFTKGVDVASAKVTEFGNKATVAFQKVGTAGNKSIIDANKLEATNQKLAAGVGRVTSLSSAYEDMGRSGINASNGLRLVQGGVEAITVGMFAAKAATTALGATLITLGVGGGIIALSALVTHLSAVREEIEGVARASRSVRDFAIPSDVREFVGELRSAREGLAGPIGGRAGLSERMASRASSLTTSDFGGSIARTGEVTRGLLRLSGEARATELGAEARGTIGSLAEMDDRLRSSITTFGMSTEATARYAAGLTRTTRTIAGVSIATTESLNPTERYLRRVDGLADAHARGRLTATRYHEELRNALRDRNAEAALIERVTRGQAELNRLQDRAQIRAGLVSTAASLIGQAGGATAAPAGLDRGSVEAVSAISAAFREASGQQNTDQQIIELNREQNRLLARQLAEAERVASILGAIQLADNVRDIFG